MRWLLFFLATLLPAQAAFSANSISVTSRQQIGNILPVVLTLTGTGNITGGGIIGSSNCSGSATLCNFIITTLCAGTTISADSAASQPIITVADLANFSVGDWLILGLNTPRVEDFQITAKSGSSGPGTLTGIANLRYTHTAVQGDGVDSARTGGTAGCNVVSSAPARVFFYYYVNNYLAVTPGTYSGTLTFSSSSGFTGSGAIAVSWQIAPYNKSTTTFTSPNGSPVGCIGAASPLWDVPCDTVTTTPTQNPDPLSTFQVPSMAGTYTDGNFGAKLTGFGPGAGLFPSDSITSCCSSDGRLALMGNAAGGQDARYITGPNIGQVAYSGIPEVDADDIFDPNNPLRVLYTNGTIIHQVILNPVPGPCSTQCVDTVFTTLAGPTGVAAYLRDSGINTDGWQAILNYVQLGISAIVPGNPTQVTVTGTIPASVTVGSLFWIDGDSSCPTLQGMAKVTSLSPFTFAVNTSSGCGSYDGGAFFESNVRVSAINVTTGVQVDSPAWNIIPGFYPTGSVHPGHQQNGGAADIVSLAFDNKYYVLAGYGGAQGSSVFTFSPGDSAMVWAYYMPGNPAEHWTSGAPFIFTSPHCSPGYVIPDAGGHSYCNNISVVGHHALVMIDKHPFFVVGMDNGGSNVGSLGDLEFLDLTAGECAIIDSVNSACGGAYHSLPLSYNTLSDIHPHGALRAPFVLGTMNDATGQMLSTCLVTNVTISSGTPTFTTSAPGASPCNFSNGDKVQISSVGGITGVNTNAPAVPFCVAGSVTGSSPVTSFTCTNLTASGSYTASTGVVVKAALPAPTSHSQLVFGVDATNLVRSNSSVVTKLAVSRSFCASNNYTDAGCYISQPHGDTTDDGRTFVYDTNFGLPGQNTSVTGLTGYNPSGSVLTGSGVLVGGKTVK